MNSAAQRHLISARLKGGNFTYDDVGNIICIKKRNPENLPKVLPEPTF